MVVAKAQTTLFFRTLMLLVCFFPACHAQGVEPEPDTNCVVWIPPPDDASDGFPIGLGVKALCPDNTTSPTSCPDGEECIEPCIELPTSVRRCWCDPGCKVYGDCCYNSMQDVCYTSGPPFPPGEIAGSEVTPERRSSEKCVRTWIFELGDFGKIPPFPDYRGHWLVANCPADYTNNEVIRRCESEQHPLRGNASQSNETETREAAHHLPVAGLSDGAHYKNIYCAVCNGVELSDILPWNIQKIPCKEESWDIFVGQVFVDCSDFAYRFHPPSSGNNSDVAVPAQPRRCIPDVIGECPEVNDGNNSTTPRQRPWEADLCRSYQALLQGVFQNKPLWFKNPHCAACHGFFPSHPGKTCFKPNTVPGSANTALSVPFDFFSFATGALDSVKPNYKCLNGFHYSVSAQKCVPNTASYERTSYVVEVDITISSEVNMAQNDSWVSTIAAIFATSLVLEPSAIIEAETPDTNYEPKANRNQEYVFSFTISNTSHVQNPARLANITDELALFVDAVLRQFPTAQVVRVQLTVPFTGNTSTDQCNSTTFDATEVELRTVGNITYIFPKDDESSIVYGAENIIFQGIYVLRNNTPDTFDVSQHFVTCNVTKDLTCYYLRLQKTSEYAIKNGVVNFIIQGLNYESAEFLEMPDGSVKICEKDIQVPRSAYSPPLYIVNIVGTSLSSLALLVTFVTYATFSSLRTVPGKATMHFVVTLFAAEILLLIPDSLPDDSPPGVCHFIAVVSHYTWLACFFWMTALGVDVSRTFSMRTGPKLVDKSGRALLWMIIFSWGTPTVIVIVCISLHFAYSPPSPGQIVFVYGRGNVCWIQPGLANLLAFGIPMMTSLLVNSALFVRTILGLRASKKITSFIEKDKSAMQRASEEFFIYLKISVLMGLTWIWYIISSATEEIVIEYFAVVFNAFNGCYVFVAFVFNRRVLSMWQRKLYGRRSADSSRSGTVSSDNSRGTTVTKASALSAYSESSLVEGSPVSGKMGLNGTRL